MVDEDAALSDLHVVHVILRFIFRLPFTANPMIARGNFVGAVALFFCALAVNASAQGNLIVTVRHAPSLNGRIEGSAQQLLD